MIFLKKFYDGFVLVEDIFGFRVCNVVCSYEEVWMKCKDFVKRVVVECERMNCRFSDVEFDIELDFVSYIFNCFYGLGYDVMSGYLSDLDDEGDGKFKKKVNIW